jgi:hypothetical protein
MEAAQRRIVAPLLGLTLLDRQRNRNIRMENKTGRFESTLEQDRQYTYNVTFRHVRVTIVAMEKQLLIHILSVCL